MIGEVVAAATDCRLKEKLGDLQGTRFIDDYYLYFDSHDSAEQALAALHEVAASLELEVNDFKTEIVPLPEPLEPSWKAELRAFDLNRTDSRQDTRLIELFDRAAELAGRFPHDNVLTYAANIVGSAAIEAKHWALCQALLLRSAIAEPSLVRRLPGIFEKNAPGGGINTSAVRATIEQLCTHHAPLQQGNEVMWALWFSKTLKLPIETAAATAVAGVDDDLVALTALHLRSENLIPALTTELWDGYISRKHLYSDHWLLAYEARAKGWLGIDAPDYTLDDPAFSILRKHDVGFYQVDAVGGAPESKYEKESEPLAAAF